MTHCNVMKTDQKVIIRKYISLFSHIMINMSVSLKRVNKNYERLPSTTCTCLHIKMTQNSLAMVTSMETVSDQEV